MSERHNSRRRFDWAFTEAIDMSAAKSRARFRSLALAAAGATLLAVWYFGSVETGNRLVQALHSAAHFPLFGAFAAVVFALLRLHDQHPERAVSRYLITFLIMVAVSLLTEGVQLSLDYRYGSLRDVGVNLLGTIAALSQLALRELGIGGAARGFAWSAAFIATAIAAQPVIYLGTAYAKRALDFPVLAQFNRPIDLAHVTGTGVRSPGRPSRPRTKTRMNPGPCALSFIRGGIPGLPFPTRCETGTATSSCSWT